MQVRVFLNFRCKGKDIGKQDRKTLVPNNISAITSLQFAFSKLRNP